MSYYWKTETSLQWLKRSCCWFMLLWLRKEYSSNLWDDCIVNTPTQSFFCCTFVLRQVYFIIGSNWWLFAQHHSVCCYIGVVGRTYVLSMLWGAVQGDVQRASSVPLAACSFLQHFQFCNFFASVSQSMQSNVTLLYLALVLGNLGWFCWYSLNYSYMCTSRDVYVYSYHLLSCGLLVRFFTHFV